MAKDDSLEIPEGALDKTERIHIPDQNFITGYVNHANISFTTWDMTIKFGEILGEKDGKPVIRDMIKILVTREFAKAFAGLLISNIQAFEKEFGEIKIPVITGPEVRKMPEIDVSALAPKLPEAKEEE